MKNDTVVLGLGNPLMADEGIGIEIITILKSASGDLIELRPTIDGSDLSDMLELGQNRQTTGW